MSTVMLPGRVRSTVLRRLLPVVAGVPVGLFLLGLTLLVPSASPSPTPSDGLPMPLVGVTERTGALPSTGLIDVSELVESGADRELFTPVVACIETFLAERATDSTLPDGMTWEETFEQAQMACLVSVGGDRPAGDPAGG